MSLSPSRRSFLSTLALAAAGPTRPPPADLPWKRAPALRPGDLIRFVAPAGPADPAQVEACRRICEAKGFRVAIPANLFRRDRYLAGSDDDRAAELDAAIRDPEARAIFPCRGGYGLTRILDRVDYRAIRDDPKIVTGFSDLTALHLAIARHARVVTLHSPMPQAALDREDGEHAYASASFWKAVRGEAGGEVALPAGRPAPTRLVGGRATGRLVGGNLTLICSTLGTPYAIEPEGNVLLIEDTGEAPYRVDRMLVQLRLAGVLDRVAGLLIGDFNETDVAGVEEVVRRECSRLRVPVLRGFPVGHNPLNATLPHGGLVELDAEVARVRLLEPAVLAD